jgi:hypothetical protein
MNIYGTKVVCKMCSNVMTIDSFKVWNRRCKKCLAEKLNYQNWCNLSRDEQGNVIVNEFNQATLGDKIGMLAGDWFLPVKNQVYID